MILKVFQTKSLDLKASGAIRIKQTQTPRAQCKLMSADDLRFTIRAISGIFQKGRTIAAIKAIFSVIFLSFCFDLVYILNKEK